MAVVERIPVNLDVVGLFVPGINIETGPLSVDDVVHVIAKDFAVCGTILGSYSLSAIGPGTALVNVVAVEGRPSQVGGYYTTGALP